MLCLELSQGHDSVAMMLQLSDLPLRCVLSLRSWGTFSMKLVLKGKLAFKRKFQSDNDEKAIPVQHHILECFCFYLSKANALFEETKVKTQFGNVALNPSQSTGSELCPLRKMTSDR